MRTTLVLLGSSLKRRKSLTYLRQEALTTFSEYLIDINGGSGLSTKVASDIASRLVIGLFEPMFAQVDPIRLGEMSAALQIANEYGNRLCEKSKSLKNGALTKLINNYPTHGFVIDRSEARNIFERVEPPTDYEKEIGDFIIRFLGKTYKNQLNVLDIIATLEEIFPIDEASDEPTETQNATDSESSNDTEGAESTAAGEPQQPK